MSTIYAPAWELFDRTFNEGDAVIVITEEDTWAWGTLRDIGDQGALLKQGNKYRSIGWADMRFMCHDGFPIRKLKRADGSSSIEKMPSQRNLIRTVLEKRFGLTELVFSDPFYIEGIVRAILYNEGNDDPNFWYTDNEEVLELVAPDGATAHLWSLATVWHAA
jgi:hypothetical protein